MNVGDPVIMLTEKVKKSYHRKGIIIAIDDLSSIGAYPDRYTVKMRKSGIEFDCTRSMFQPAERKLRHISEVDKG